VLIHNRYHVPPQIQEHIDYITPGVKLHTTGRGRAGSSGLGKRIFGVTGGKGDIRKPDFRPASQFAPLLTGCDSTITPACIKGM
jgi:tripeptidyl-peptidase-1